MTRDPNVVNVELVASLLGSLMEELVLVGGCAVGILVTDEIRAPVRATEDIDLVTEISPLASYYKFCNKLKACGFVLDRLRKIAGF